MKRHAIQFCALVAPLIIAASSPADVPSLINYQGILANSAGEPLDGTYDLTFKVYEDSLTTSALWAEVHTGVAVSSGLFNVLLGGQVAITPDLFTATDRWLGITVNTDPEIDPRFRITSVPWAFRAAVAESALVCAGGAADGHSLDAADGDPEDAVYVNDDGNVGIGTTNPGTNKLYVNGGVLKVMGPGGEDGTIRMGNAGNIQYNTEGYQTEWSFTAGDWQSQLTFKTRDHDGDMHSAVMDMDGNVGVGTTDPSEKLDVAGTAQMTGFRLPTGATAGYVLTSNGSGVGTWQPSAGGMGGAGTTNYVAKFTGPQVIGNSAIYEGGGDVGIGTDSPAAKLDVAGTARITGFEMPTGATNGYVLTSDPTGAGSWQPASVDDGDWTVAGSDMYSAVSGNVGIGTSTPSSKLTIAGGGIRLTDNGAGVSFVHGSTYISELYNDLIIYAQGELGRILLLPEQNVIVGTSSSNVWAKFDNSTERLGIGETNPSESLDIGGNMRLQGGEIKDAGGTARIRFASGGDVELVDEGGTVGLTIDTDGNTRLTGRLTVQTNDYSIGGTYVGNTPDSYNGAAVGGYPGARAKCVLEYGSLAHMCSAEELVRSMQLGISPTASGWYSTGLIDNDESLKFRDCLGWTSSSEFGTWWNAGLAAPSSGSCIEPIQLLCCR